jgi:hypothetical protein
MRVYVRRATVEEVLAALQDRETLDPKTAAVAWRHRDDWHLWEFDGDGMGVITNGNRPIGDYYPSYIQDLARPDYATHQATHAYFLEKLRCGQDIGFAVMLHEDYDCDIANGGHRSFAAYEFAQSNPSTKLKAFWNQGRERA